MAEAAGKRIGNYVVQALLGEGGMGAVYSAKHYVIGRQVAIKILRRDLAGQEALVARFLNEARAPGVAKHPGIVEVFDVGTLPAGTPYLVMEYLHGESLAQKLARTGRVGVDEAIDIACQTASALAAAHANGIVHRDLKPANLFLVREPGSAGPDRIKVLDFGIAKLRTDSAPTPADTQSGTLVGTPVYMSPEQCRGVRDEIDHRTDIYSLGTILYQMVCGVPPFVGEGWGDLLLRHMTEEPVRPSLHEATVSPALEQVVLRALAKRKEDRFASMGELQRALMEVSGKPPGLVLASLPSSPLPIAARAETPAAAPVRRTRRRVALVAGAIAAVVIGTMTWHVTHKPRAADSAVTTAKAPPSNEKTSRPAPLPIVPEPQGIARPPTVAPVPPGTRDIPARRRRSARSGQRQPPIRVEQW